MTLSKITYNLLVHEVIFVAIRIVNLTIDLKQYDTEIFFSWTKFPHNIS